MKKTKEIKKIYIAGALNAMSCDYIKNLHRMIVWSEKVRKLGCAVFVPGIDILCGIVSGNLEYEDYFQNSQPWLMVCDAVFLVPGWEKSKGTAREIKLARSLGIPVCSDIKKLKKFIKYN